MPSKVPLLESSWTCFAWKTFGENIIAEPVVISSYEGIGVYPSGGVAPFENLGSKTSIFFLSPKYESKTSSIWKKLEKIEPAPTIFVFLSAKQFAKLAGISLNLSASLN